VPRRAQLAEDDSIDFDVMIELVFPDRGEFLNRSWTRAFGVEEFVTSG